MVRFRHSFLVFSACTPLQSLEAFLRFPHGGCFVDVFVKNTIGGDSQLPDADIHADNPIFQFDDFRVHFDTDRQIPVFAVELDARIVVFAIHGQRFVGFHPTDLFQQDAVAFHFQLDAIIVETRCGTALGLEPGMLGLPVEKGFVGFVGVLDRLFDDIVGNVVQPSVFFPLLHLGDVLAQLIVADERPTEAMGSFPASGACSCRPSEQRQPPGRVWKFRLSQSSGLSWSVSSRIIPFYTQSIEEMKSKTKNLNVFEEIFIDYKKPPSSPIYHFPTEDSRLKE